MDYQKASEIVAENLKTIYAYALSRVSKQTEAEDLASDIVLSVIESAPKIKCDDAFYGYLWKTASNRYKKYLTKKSRAAENYADFDENGLQEPLDFTQELPEHDEINVLQRELSLLSGEYRECTVAYYIDNLSCREIAEKFSLSLEMVKYYLFKTRKILKEGIDMEREFGTKSYAPSKFEFQTIFSGSFNREYRNLFNRRLVGNILLSAYYTPMNIRELSIELGISAAYMEDEVELLKKYNLVTELPRGKYQTNLLILTNELEEDFKKCAIPVAMDYISRAAGMMRSSLDEIRKIGFIGCNLSENQLMWGLFYMLMQYGWRKYPYEKGEYEIYDGAAGINYGVAYEVTDKRYFCSCFAGDSGVFNGFRMTFANFDVLPEKNHVNFDNKFRSVTEKLKIDPEHTEAVGLTEAEKEQILEILDPATDIIGELYVRLTEVFLESVKDQAPQSVIEIAEKIISSLIYHHTVGLIGGAALDSGAMPMPDFDSPAALYLTKIN